MLLPSFWKRRVERSRARSMQSQSQLEARARASEGCSEKQSPVS